MQNDDKIQIEEIYTALEKNSEYLRDNLVLVESEELIALEIKVLNDYEKEKGYKKGKSYYIPEKEELLRYADYTYFDRTNEYKDLLKFLTKVLSDKSKVEELANEIRIFCKSVDGINNLSVVFEKYNLLLKDSRDANELMELIVNVADNTRLWGNNGYTPNEMIDIKRMGG